MNKLTIYKIAKNIWIPMLVFTLVMGGLGAYLNGTAIFSTSKLYQSIFIMSFGFGEILLILVGAIIMIKTRMIVLRRLAQ